MRAPVWRQPGMTALVAVSVAGFSGYAVLLPVAPLWVVHGGAGPGGAGLVNGVLLGATVLTQLAVPRLLVAFGYGPVIAAGLLLLGAPAPAFLWSDGLALALGLSTVRGVGFGIVTVTGSALVAHLVPPERRGAAVGVYGLAAAIPNLLLIPAAAAVVEQWGFGVVFAVGAVPVLGIPAALRLGRVADAAARTDPLAAAEPSAGLDRRTALAVALPTLVLFAVTMGGGALITFAPQVLPSGRSAALVLLVLGAGTVVCRLGAGHVADRHGGERFLVPLLVVGAAGLAVCAWGASRGGSVALLAVGAALVGVAYGALQNLTLVVAFAHVPRHQIARASAGWNIGFDAGTATGAVAVGVVADASSFGVAFLMVGAVCLLATGAGVPLLRGPGSPGRG